MTRSRKRKLKRMAMTSVPLASTMLVGHPAALAQQQDQVSSGTLQEIVVSAQKRDESLQNVPLSVTAYGTEQLEQLRVTKFDDVAKFLPSVSYQTFGPGFAQIYMRGVASGGDGNHSGSLPSVGVYLDEQPVTTIQGPMDIHMYDIARVEALAGPQGTLYGASSQAGTVRIITNKPQLGEFDAAYQLSGSAVADGDFGYVAEGFVNVPVGERAAIRLVGWAKHEPGYIDNVFGTRTYPSSGITDDNAAFVDEDYNYADTYGARAALRIDLDENWTVTPAVMGQKQETNGIWAFDPLVGDLAVTHFNPENTEDRWIQAALTVQGRISNFDVVYAGALLDREDRVNSDYSDYAFFYDQLYYYGNYFYDDDGNLVNPSQYINGRDDYRKYTHELRISSPQDWRFRFVAGAFVQRQKHHIFQRYLVDDIAQAIEVTDWPDTIWLTAQERIDRDKALFGEVYYDITPRLTATAGIRFFESRNSLEGFFGYGPGFSSTTGEAACFSPERILNSPCKNLDKVVEEDGDTGKLSLTWRVTDDHMLYATWSEGFRPGGINRRGTLPPYLADFLTNYEIGWKTTWGGRLRFNGAIFHADWEDFQFSYLGANGLTEIKNAAQARIRGIETSFDWAATPNLTLGGGFALYDAELTENYCGFLDIEGNPVTDCPDPEAPSGTELPVTADFKANLTARYHFPLGTFRSYVQGSFVYNGSSWPDLRISDREALGEQESYSLFDFSFGVERDTYSLELFVNNAFDERAQIFRTAQCAPAVCGDQVYIYTTPPRTIGVRFSQRF